MRRTIWVAIMVLIVTGANFAADQSLGDYARNVRKDKPQSSTTSRHYDNDNLPTGGRVNVVGREPAAQPTNGQEARETNAPGPAAAQAAKQQADQDLQDKIKEQQEKVDGLSHELTLDQREYRLRAAWFYASRLASQSTRY